MSKKQVETKDHRNGLVVKVERSRDPMKTPRVSWTSRKAGKS